MKTKSRLKVTFPDGSSFCYKDAVFTVIEVLRKIGSDRFEDINLEVKGTKLIAPTKHGGLHSFYSKEVADGWYYLNQSSVYTKYLQLYSISNQLQLNLSIEVGEDLEALPNPKMGSQRRPLRKVKVTMADGSIIDYDRFADVFMTCIDRLGPRRLSLKANFKFCGEDLFTTCNPTGRRLKVADFLYVTVPSSAKETYKLLNLIVSRMGLSKTMRVELTPCA